MKKSKSSSKAAKSPSKSGGTNAKNSSGWQGEMLDRIRKLIQEADPEAVEEMKWKKPSNPAGVPAWSHGGIICTGETYKNAVKITFAKGASLADPAGLFNSSLEGNTRRAIDFHEARYRAIRAHRGNYRFPCMGSRDDSRTQRREMN
jgi:hypothetical protein